jgi:anthranilate 1,2-dioxygenase small subunit
MEEMQLTHRLAQLNARYARSLDSGRLEEWPEYFTDACSYRVTTLDNHTRGLPGALIYAKGKGMLLDRVQALRGANIYEGQTYRHVVGTPLVERDADGGLRAQTPFFVLRTMRTGAASIFASGAYHDRLASDGEQRLRFAERVVVCDSSRIDTLLAIPL